MWYGWNTKTWILEYSSFSLYNCNSWKAAIIKALGYENAGKHYTYNSENPWKWLMF